MARTAWSYPRTRGLSRTLTLALGFPASCSNASARGLRMCPFRIGDRVFRDDEHLEAHSTASSQPSENSSDTGRFFTTFPKCGTSAKAQIRDSPVSSSRLQTNVVL